VKKSTTKSTSASLRLSGEKAQQKAPLRLSGEKAQQKAPLRLSGEKK
jgi:hypothetical protein